METDRRRRGKGEEERMKREGKGKEEKGRGGEE